MNTYSLVISLPFEGTQVANIQAANAEEAKQMFETDKDNSGCEVLHIIEHESPHAEVVIDLSNGLINQVFSNQPNIEIVFLDGSSNEVASELENEGSNFVPDIDLNEQPDEQAKNPWVFRTCEVEHDPALTHHYLSLTKDEQAVERFSEKVYDALG